MDLLQSYDSDSSDLDEPMNTHATQSLDRNAVRSVYLVTYSQADLRKFATRAEFASAVVESFSRSTVRILHWCCSQEPHQQSGVHYHMCIKLDRNHRWLPSKHHLKDTYDISVHYSNVHHNYYSAWRYVTKEDSAYVQSDNHPRFASNRQPRTNPASFTRHSRARPGRQRRGRTRVSASTSNQHTEDNVEEDDSSETRQTDKAKRRKRMSGYEVSEIIVAENIKNVLELQALAAEQKKEGKTSARRC